MSIKKENQNNGLPKISIKGAKKKAKNNKANVKVAKKIDTSKKKPVEKNLTNLIQGKKKKSVDKAGRDNRLIQERIAKKKALVIDGLKEGFGIVTNAIVKAGVSNQTFYNWYKDDEDFKKLVDDTQGQFDIIVKDKIKQGIIQNDGSMIRFYASRKIKEFMPKVGLGQADDLEPFEFIIKTKKITDDENGED